MEILEKRLVENISVCMEEYFVELGSSLLGTLVFAWRRGVLESIEGLISKVCCCFFGGGVFWRIRKRFVWFVFFC